MTQPTHSQRLTARLALWAALLAGLLLILLGGGPAQAGGPDLPFQAISAGITHTCGLRPDGSLVCWGLNNSGQMTVPALSGGLSYTQVSAGAWHTCGLRSDGSLLCWGLNNNGRTTVPTLTGGQSYSQVSAGDEHTCGLRSDGTLLCWGVNGQGQTTVPALPGGLSYTQVSAGGSHTCGLVSDGSLVCWGWNGYGQTTVPTLPAGQSYTQVSAGGFHTCGLVSDGALRCWGFNSDGQTAVPPLPGGQSYSQVSAGEYYTCGLVSDGSVVCWGDSGAGLTTVPALPAGLSYSQISAEFGHTCGLRSDGSIVCWGWNGDGQTNVPALIFGRDTTSPSVVSSWRVAANPTVAVSVDFTVTFSEFVVGVDATDFTLTTSGLTGAAITGVSGSGSVYTVTVSTGTASGNGTLRLDVVANDSIRDAVNLPLGSAFTGGESYDVVDIVAPTVVSSLRADASPTTADSVDFTVTFSEDVTGVDVGDFDLTTTGVSGAAVTGVSGSGSVYTVTVSTGSGSGDIQLTIPASATITDSADHALGSLPFNRGESYDVAMASVVYLPLIFNGGFTPVPDLVVDSLSTTGSQVTVTISNQGNAPVVDAFWVDVYLNPTTAPGGVNQPWAALGSQGLVWGVEGAALPLDPGQSLTLTIGDSYYWPDLSSFNTPLPVGSSVYAQVDSANALTIYGGVLESHEISGGAYNNITGPVLSVAGGAVTPAADGSSSTAAGSNLPPRE